MKNNRQSGCRGFTMVEMLGAVIISVILIMLLFQIFNKVQSVLVVSQNRARVMEQGRNALDFLAQDFRSLGAASLTDPISGNEIPNIDWGYVGWKPTKPYGQLGSVLYPRRVVYAGVGYVLKTHVPGVKPADQFGLIDPLNMIPPKKSDWWATVGSLGDDERRLLNGTIERVSYLSPIDVTDARWQDTYGSPSYENHALEVHRHQCKFFTNDEGWRFVDYKFGGRNHYSKINPASPVGALWVYRSRVVRRSGLKGEWEDHAALKKHDPLPNPGSGSQEQDGLVGYSRVVDGVIHFRVSAVSPREPEMFTSPTTHFYTGRHAPSLVEVEIAVVDDKLVAEMEAGIEQRMEGQPNLDKYKKKVEYIEDNLDRVYFFKQLISIQEKGQ